MHPFNFGTKAETLERLQNRVESAKVLPLCYFSVGDWLVSRNEYLQKIEGSFGGTMVAIRSSALVEDGAEKSMAGAFLSQLNVDCSNRLELEAAIDQVV